MRPIPNSIPIIKWTVFPFSKRPSIDKGFFSINRIKMKTTSSVATNCSIDVSNSMFVLLGPVMFPMFSPSIPVASINGRVIITSANIQAKKNRIAFCQPFIVVWYWYAGGISCSLYYNPIIFG